jgi:hypothetical protein
MGTYTEMLEDKGKDTYPEDDNYTEMLLEFAELFRNFDEAIDDFVRDHGYTGDIADIDGKTSFIQSKFEQASISFRED